MIPKSQTHLFARPCLQKTHASLGDAAEIKMTMNFAGPHYGEAEELDRWESFARIILHPFPCALVGFHWIIMSIWIPIAVATTNTETAPLGLELIAWINSIGIAACDYWPGPPVFKYPWSVVGIPLICGTLQWYVIGLLPIIAFRLCQRFWQGLIPSTTDERAVQRSSPR